MRADRTRLIECQSVLIAERFSCYCPQMRYDDENGLQDDDDPSIIPPMTVCVAAICDGGKAVIVAADRSIAYGRDFFTSNGVTCKISPISPRAAIAVANVPLGADFISKITSDENLPVIDIAERVRSALENLRRARAEKEISAKLGKTYDAFLEECFKPSSDDALVQIKKDFLIFSLDSRVIIAGVGSEGGRLFRSNSTITMSSMDDAGFAAIGAGEHLAMGNLFTRSPLIKEMSIGEAAYFVYEAKKMAERHRGVGNETDMFIVRDSVIRVTNEQLEGLEKVYKVLKVRELTNAQARSINSLIGI